MNNLRLNPDDPKWTAYVLGELEDAERAEIERLLETSEEARALVEELNLATMTLKDELAPIGALAMTPEQKAEIRAAAEPPPSRWFTIMPTKWNWVAAGVAAAVVLAVMPLVLTRPVSQDNARIAAVPPSETGKIAQVLSPPETQSDLRQQENAKDRTIEARERTESNNRKDANVAEQKLENLQAQEHAATPPPPPPAVAESFQGTIVVPAGPIDNPALVGATGAVRLTDELKKEAAAPAATPTPVAAPAAAAALPGRGAGGGGGRGGGGRGGAAQRGQAQLGQAASSSLTTDAITGDALLDLPDNEADLLRYLTNLAAARGIVDGELNIRVDGFQSANALPARNAAGAPPPPPPPPPNGINAPRPNTEAYDRIIENPFIRTSLLNLATLSIDVDTASYANVRRFLTQNQMPPRDAVRIEEMINYFNYDYAQPAGRDPIAPNMEVAAAPWNPANRLVRIGIKARDIDTNRRPSSNLVFLIDVSGSMDQPAKLPLVKSGLKMLVDRLGENDRVSIVVYAGASGLVLPPTSAARKDRIVQAIDSLQPGGSTNGASGIQLAYNQAVINFIKGGTNRVILMTDGDFNVGITNQGDLTRLIEDRAKSGVFLSVLGFGMGNIKDSTLEKLADQGNGNYAYIDSVNEARKVLVEEMGATLITVAKDVKIQVDFNPARVEAYRLIGYENRLLRTQDFNNDLKDAGDMGAGHTVTAFFEVVPKGGNVPGPSIDPSKYTQPPAAAPAAGGNAATSNEMLTLRVRYKQPDGDVSSVMNVPLVDQNRTFSRASADFRFAAAVAQFGMILRDSPYRGNSSIEGVLDTAEGSRGQDRSGYRREFIDLVQRARRLR